MTVETRRQVLKWTAAAKKSDPKANVGRVLDKLVADGKREFFCPTSF